MEITTDTTERLDAPGKPAWFYEEWVAILRREVEEAQAAGSSQEAVARKLGYKGGTISGILSGTYGANPARVKAKVIEVFGTWRTVTCPVLGELTLKACAEERGRDFSVANPLRVRLYRACQTCPHNPANALASAPAAGTDA